MAIYLDISIKFQPQKGLFLVVNKGHKFLEDSGNLYFGIPLVYPQAVAVIISLLAGNPGLNLSLPLLLGAGVVPRNIQGSLKSRERKKLLLSIESWLFNRGSL